MKAASFHPDLFRQDQSHVACHAERSQTDWVEGQQVGRQVEGQQEEGQQLGGQAEGQQVGGQEKNGQQYRLSSPIVWSVHKHYSTQGSRAITQPSNS
ncbi:TPA: hypothetical protein ACH3X3_012743 [Trebouxia sp. C0006]